MAHFAHINAQGIVDQVLVISEENLTTGNWGNPAEFVQTSYNTAAGEYTKGETEAIKLSLKTSGTAKDIAARNRKNYAAIGYTYDKTNDMFIPPKPFDSWKLDKNTARWYAPKPMPTDGKRYAWDEVLLAWIVIA